MVSVQTATLKQPHRRPDRLTPSPHTLQLRPTTTTTTTSYYYDHYYYYYYTTTHQDRKKKGKQGFSGAGPGESCDQKLLNY